MDEKFTLLLAETDKRNKQRFDAQQEAVQSALISAEKAVTKAETAAEKRFESVNEFRKSLSDQTQTFLTRLEYSAQHEALTEKVDQSIMRMTALEKQITEISSRGSGRNDIWIILVAVIGLVLAGASMFIHIKG